MKHWWNLAVSAISTRKKLKPKLSIDSII